MGNEHEDVKASINYARSVFQTLERMERAHAYHVRQMYERLDRIEEMLERSLWRGEKVAIPMKEWKKYREWKAMR